MLSLHSGLSCPYLSNPKSSQNPQIFRQSNGAQNADLPKKLLMFLQLYNRRKIQIKT